MKRGVNAAMSQRELALKVYFPDRDGPDPDPLGTKRKAAIAAMDAAREKKAKAAAALDAKRQKTLAARAAQADSKASKLREAEKRRAENVALAEAKQAAALTARSASMVTMPAAQTREGPPSPCRNPYVMSAGI